MNKEILNLVEKVFIFLKLEDFSKLKKLIDFTGITLKRLCFSLIHTKIMKM